MDEHVTIVILTHKSKKLVLDYIKNLYKKFKIIIVDNSKDIELEKIIKTNFPGIEIYLISNNGYSNQINFGYKFVKTKYFLISNPDVRGIDEKGIQNFINAAIKLDDKFSVLGPRYINANPKSLKQTKNDKEIAELRILSGACMFFNKKNYELVGGFDNNIFLYFEENDYCKRSINFFKNYQINNIEIFHEGGNSVSCESQSEIKDQQELRQWHFVWSKFYYYKKNYGYIYAVIFFLPIIFRTGLKIFLYLVIKDEVNCSKYKNRWSGMMSSIKGEKSHKRPKF